MMKTYAGVGSRETPPEVVDQIVAIGRIAAAAGWTLRSGAANGADAAFERGCDIEGGSKEIYLPWKGFNGHTSQLYDAPPHAYARAAEVHPAWGRLSEAMRKLHSRNMQQVFGEYVVDPVQFVVCWTSDGCEHHAQRNRATGGTGTAISAASRAGIPVYNLRNEGRYQAVLDLLTKGDND